MHNSVRLLLFAQLSLFFFLFICFMLIPHFLLESNEGGISNYGTYAKTVVPYTLAFGLGGLLTIRAAKSLPKRMSRHQALYWVLSITGGLYLLVLLSTYPYKLNKTFDNIHTYAGFALAVFGMMTAFWFALVLARNFLNLVLLSAQTAGFILAILNYLGYVHLLFVAELLTGTAFGALLVRGVGYVTSNKRS
jgi:hypothetical protein